MARVEITGRNRDPVHGDRYSVTIDGDAVNLVTSWKQAWDYAEGACRDDPTLGEPFDRSDKGAEPPPAA